jgi:hypothetical protein
MEVEMELSLTIHRYWTGDALPPVTSQLAGRIIDRYTNNTPGLFMDWTDNMLPDEIMDLVTAHDSDVPETQRAKHRSNIVRYALLRQFGGIWLDHDLLLLQPPERFGSWVAFSQGQICTAAMYFPLGDPHLDAALDAVAPADTAWEASGEGMLKRAGVWTDVHQRELPFDYRGGRTRASMWAIHMWGSRGAKP